MATITDSRVQSVELLLTGARLLAGHGEGLVPDHVYADTMGIGQGRRKGSGSGHNRLPDIMGFNTDTDRFWCERSEAQDDIRPELSSM